MSLLHVLILLLNLSNQTYNLIISGEIKNTHNDPIDEVQVILTIKGKPIPNAKVETGSNGIFVLKTKLYTNPTTLIEKKQMYIYISRPNYVTRSIPITKLATENGNYVSYLEITMHRSQTIAFWIAAAILVLVYLLIALDVVHRTHAALIGTALLLLITYTIGQFNEDWFIISFEEAIHSIDLNVIFLLMSMMIIVGIMKKTGVFQWLAYKSFQISRGNIFILVSLLLFITAFLSAFLDNVTTVLLIIPVTIEIANTLKINPIYILIPEAFASNVGGTATLIGDPPNIMIGSYAKLSFVDFLVNLTPPVLIGLAFTILWYLLVYRKTYSQAKVTNYKEMVERLRQEYKITDKKLLTKSLVVLGIVILLFIVHGTFNMEPSIAAMFGAGLLILIAREDIVEALEKEVEWATLVFFMFLFIVVGAAETTGIIQAIATWVKDLSGSSLVLAMFLVLWVSAIASAIVDNIPFTATMLPVVAFLSGPEGFNLAQMAANSGVNPNLLWWALALGACLGGNGTLVGASANVVTVGIAEKAGFKVSFMRYMKITVIPTIITLIISTLWLLLVEM